MVVVGDIGSTFTKLVGVSTAGTVIASVKVPTRRHNLVAGVDRARELLVRDAGRTDESSQMTLSSSAGGGLRVVVLGLEPALTLAAGMRAGATAGARVVATYAVGELAGATAESFHAVAPDLALLTGGTNGGNAAGMVSHAHSLRRLAPTLPVVVAGNEDAHHRVGEILGCDRLVRFARNAMPRIGELNAESAQREIRKLFVEHVIGHGRFASASPIARSVRMPTPAAVLAAAEVIANTPGPPVVRRPVVVDVGGATTDVHSVIPIEAQDRGYITTGLGDDRVTRTVEGDLGMRENATSVVEAARRESYPPKEILSLEAGARRRGRHLDFVPADAYEREIDDRLAGIATAIALSRHAGRLQTVLTPGGAVLRKDGRDLRHASCVIATGGIFAHSRQAREIVADALRRVHARGGLVPRSVPVLVDRRYLLWAVGLLSVERPQIARRLLTGTLSP